MRKGAKLVLRVLPCQLPDVVADIIDYLLGCLDGGHLFGGERTAFRHDQPIEHRMDIAQAFVDGLGEDGAEGGAGFHIPRWWSLAVREMESGEG